MITDVVGIVALHFFLELLFFSVEFSGKFSAFFIAFYDFKFFDHLGFFFVLFFQSIEILSPLPDVFPEHGWQMLIGIIINASTILSASID